MMTGRTTCGRACPHKLQRRRKALQVQLRCRGSSTIKARITACSPVPPVSSHPRHRLSQHPGQPCPARQLSPYCSSLDSNGPSGSTSLTHHEQDGDAIVGVSQLVGSVATAHTRCANHVLQHVTWEPADIMDTATSGRKTDRRTASMQLAQATAVLSPCLVVDYVLLVRANCRPTAMWCTHGPALPHPPLAAMPSHLLQHVELRFRHRVEARLLLRTLRDVHLEQQQHLHSQHSRVRHGSGECQRVMAPAATDAVHPRDGAAA